MKTKVRDQYSCTKSAKTKEGRKEGRKGGRERERRKRRKEGREGGREGGRNERRKEGTKEKAKKPKATGQEPMTLRTDSIWIYHMLLEEM